MSSWVPLFDRVEEEGRLLVRLGDPLVDLYLAFVALRLRPNSVLAVAYDLKVFFTVVAKTPADVRAPDVFEFLTDQRRPRHGNVVRLIDGESGLSSRTIRRRLSSVAGFYDYLVVRGDCGVAKNPVPRRTIARGAGPQAIGLIRTRQTLPRIIDPATADRLLGACRRQRDRAMFEAMLLGGLRRCEVLGLRLEDVRPGERRLFIAEGKGGRQRIVPVAKRFFDSLSRYFAGERPSTTSSSVFVVMQGRTRGLTLSPAGIDEILTGACRRGGIGPVTCHQLRHTCMTRLREAGMSIEAVQAQAGHRLLETTRMYLHLSDRWLADEYLAAMAAIDADLSTHSDAEASSDLSRDVNGRR